MSIFRVEKVKKILQEAKEDPLVAISISANKMIIVSVLEFGIIFDIISAIKIPGIFGFFLNLLGIVMFPAIFLWNFHRM